MGRTSPGCAVRFGKCVDYLKAEGDPELKLMELNAIDNLLKTALKPSSRIGNELDTIRGKEWRQELENISALRTLTSEQEAFLKSLAKDIIEARKGAKKAESRAARQKARGLYYTESALLYLNFREAVPNATDREEILMQIVSAVQTALDVYVEDGEAADHLDAFNKHKEKIFENVRNIIKSDIQEYYKGREGDPRKDVAFRVVDDLDVWNAAIYLAKGVLFEAEKIKIGKALSYVQKSESVDTTTVDDNGNVVQIAVTDEDTREKWMKMADTISSFNSLSKEARSILYRLETGETGILGQPSVFNVMKVHDSLTNLFFDRAILDSQELKQELDNARQQWATALGDLIAIADEDTAASMLTTLFVAYSKNKQDYHYLNDNRGNTYINSARTQSSELVMAYLSNSYSIPTTNTDCLFNSKGAFDKTKVKEFLERWLFNKTSARWESKYYQDKKFTEAFTNLSNDSKKRLIGAVNQALNLQLSTDTMDNFLLQDANFESFIKQVTSLFANIGPKILARSIRNMDNVIQDDATRGFLGRALHSISKATSTFEENIPAEKSVRFNGSNFMTSVTASFLGDQMLRLRNAAIKGGVAQLKRFIADTYLTSSIFYNEATGEIKNKWLQRLNNTTEEDIRNSESFFNQFTSNVIRALGVEGKAWEDFIEKDNFAFSFKEFVADLSSLDKTSSQLNESLVLTKMPLFVTGDSNSARYLTVTLEQLGTSDFKDIIINEIHRMITMKNMGIEIDNVSDNLYKFSYFPILNTTFKDVNGKDITLNIQEIVEAYEKGNSSKISSFEDFLDNNVNHLLEEGFRKFKADLIEEKLITEGVEGDVLFGKEFYRALPPKLKEALLQSKNAGYDRNELLKKWYLNSKYHMIQQLQFFTIDPAFYSGTNDAQKRYKEVIASGNKFDTGRIIKDKWDKKNPDGPYTKQTVLYFKDIKKNMFDEDIEFMRKLQSKGLSHLDNYEKSSLTDGQAWRNFSSYRKLMIMAGGDRWTKSHEEVYEIIMKARQQGRRLTKEEGKQIAQKNVTFQPLKLYYYGFESIGGELVPVQHKYAEWPLIPELLPEGATKLHEMARLMQDHGIDLIAASSCVKVGAHGVVDIAKDGIQALKKATIHTLDIANLREQNNVPEHNDTMRARGTQAVKHGYMGLSEFGDKDVSEIAFLNALRASMPKGAKLNLDGKTKIDLSGKITGKDMMRLYNVLGSAGFLKTFTSLNREFGNDRAISKMLISLSELSNTSTPDDVLAYQRGIDGKLNIPPSELTKAFDNFASLISRFKKDVIQQKFHGGSLVQASALGLEDVLKVHYNEAGTNITHVDCARTFDFSYTGFNGEKVELDYYEYVDPNTGELIDEQGKTVGDEVEKSKLWKQFPGIVDMVAYRIPTERAYSMINARATRFFPKTMGGLIMLPTQFTTIAGFDFDIDKLYYLTKEYKIEDIDKSVENSQIWGDYYGINDGSYKRDKQGELMYEYLKKARTIVKQTISSNLQDAFAYLGTDSESYSAFQKWLTSFHKSLRFNYRSYQKSEQKALERLYKALEKEGCGDLEIQALRAQIENYKESPIHKGRLYHYWNEALTLLQAEGVDISTYPKTPTEAFSKYVRGDLSHAKWANSFDYKKSILDHDQSAINNMMMDYIWSRLQDEDTFEERYTPGGFYNFKDAKGIMMAIRYGDISKCKSLEDLVKYAQDNGFDQYYNPNYDITEPSTLAHYQTWNALYDKLIGASANQNIQQRLTALMDKIELKAPIRFGSLVSADPNSGKNIKIREINGKDSDLTTTELLAASVDAVKDALLEFFGIDNKTFTLTCLMARIGATPTDIGLLLNQPIVQKACKLIKVQGGKLNLSQALEQTFKEMYNEDYDKVTVGSLSMQSMSNDVGLREKELSLDNLVKSLANPNNSKGTQLAVLHIMKELQAVATKLSDTIKISKTSSTNTIAATPGELLSLIMSADVISNEMVQSDYPFDIEVDGRKRILNTHLFVGDNIHKVMQKCINSPFAMEQVAFSCLRTFVERTLGKWFPYSTQGYKTMIRSLMAITKDNKINGDMLNDFLKDFPQYCISRTLPEFSDELDVIEDEELIKELCTIYIKGEAMTLDELDPALTTINRRDFYNTVFPIYYNSVMERNKREVAEGKDVRDYSKIPILAAITSPRKNTKDTEVLQLIIPNIGKQNKTSKAVLRDSWLTDLLDSDDPILRNIGNHLIYYNYFKAGLTFSPVGFSSLISTNTILDDSYQSYRDFFNLMFDWEDSGNVIKLTTPRGDVEINKKDILINYILNHYKQYYQINKSYLSDELKNIITQQLQTTPNSFIADPSNSAFSKLYSKSEKKIGKKETITEYKWVPSIVIDGDVYVCDNGNTDMLFNTSTQTITYYKMEPPASTRDYSTPSRASDTKVENNSPLSKAMRVIKSAWQDDLSKRAVLNLNEEEGHFDGSSENTGSASLTTADRVSELLGILQSFRAFFPDAYNKAKAVLDEENLNMKALYDILLKLDPSNLKNANTSELKALARAYNKIWTAYNNLQDADRDYLQNISNITNPVVQESCLKIISYLNVMGRRITGGRGLGTGRAQIDRSPLTMSVTSMIEKLFPQLGYDLVESAGAKVAPRAVRQAAGKSFDAFGRLFFNGGSTLAAILNLSEDVKLDLSLAMGGFLAQLDEKYGRGNYWILTDEHLIGNNLMQDGELVNPVAGIMDMLLVTPDAVWILDFKTGVGKMSEGEKRRYYTQLMMYQMMLKAAFPELNFRCKLLHAEQKFTNLRGLSEMNGEIFQDNIPVSAINALSYDVEFWDLSAEDDPALKKVAEDLSTKKITMTEVVSLSEQIDKEVEENKDKLNLCN